MRKPRHFKITQTRLSKKKRANINKHAGLLKNVVYDIYYDKRDDKRAQGSAPEGRRVVDEQTSELQASYARFKSYDFEENAKMKLLNRNKSFTKNKKRKKKKFLLKDIPTNRRKLELEYPPLDLSNTNLRFHLNPHGPSSSRYFLKSRLRKYIPSVHAK